MRHITIIATVYSPNTAYNNRLFSFIEAFIKHGILIDVYFLHATTDYDTVKKDYLKVKFHYLWKKSDNKCIARIRSLWNILKMPSLLSDGDNIFVYGAPEFVPVLVRRKNLHVYHERTEHPDVVPLSRLVSKEKYYSSCRKLDGLFVISTALRDLFEGKQVPKEKIHIINMTVDANRFLALKKQHVKERYIAYCGTASNNKDGVDVLIKAFAIVTKKIKDVKLYIIGKAPSKNDESGNIALIEELDIQDRVYFPGIIQADRMPQILKDAEVVALARPDNLQARCGFATKIGEYLLSENPVVVTRVGDFPLFLKDGETALICEPNNIEEFADKLEWALTHKEEAQNIGKRGAKVALECFNSEIEAKKVLNIIFGNN